MINTYPWRLLEPNSRHPLQEECGARQYKTPSPRMSRDQSSDVRSVYRPDALQFHAVQREDNCNFLLPFRPFNGQKLFVEVTK